jgi:hypothetical protein
MVQLAGGEDCEISENVEITTPAAVEQVPTPAVAVAGQTQ